MYLAGSYKSPREQMSVSKNYQTVILYRGPSHLIKLTVHVFQLLYYYMRNFCNLIGLEQCYFTLI